MKREKNFKRRLFIGIAGSWEIFARAEWEKFSHFLKRVRSPSVSAGFSLKDSR
jgi:hypothetical protein